MSCLSLCAEGFFWLSTGRGAFVREMGKSLAFCDKDCGDQGPERLTGEDSVSGVRPARVLLLYDASLVSGSSAVSGNRPVHLSICPSVFLSLPALGKSGLRLLRLQGVSGPERILCTGLFVAVLARRLVCNLF